jgi:glucose/arabinose dehydrogenase
MRPAIVAAILCSLLGAGRAEAQFASTEVSGPGSPTPFLVTKAGWSWEDIPCVTYSVRRSALPDSGFDCIHDMHPTNTWAGDPTPIPQDSVYHYVVRAFDGDSDNSPGRWSDGTPRAPGVACVRTPPPCTSGTPVPGPYTLRLVRLSATNFSSPIFLTAPIDDPRIFVLERAGRIQIHHPDGTRTLFLDFSARVQSTASEKGALGLAFHPDYDTNGLFYVDYSGAVAGACGPENCGTVAEYRVSVDPDVANPASERIVMQIEDDRGNHNGGWIGFGPDRFLYISIGDGGAQGDPGNRGQDLGTWYAKILRIDVDGRGAGLQYAIPGDNPFVGVAGAREEIWSYGMRNPWRCSFDRATGDFYVADVGQGTWEEISALPSDACGLNAGRGANLGWRIMEGLACYNPPIGCDQTGLTLPVHQYQHVSGDCSVTGGYVYRGCRMPDLQGTYFFADWCSDWIDSFEVVGGVATNLQRMGPVANAPVSFGEDAAGEVYVINGGGSIWRIEP